MCRSTNGRVRPVDCILTKSSCTWHLLSVVKITSSVHNCFTWPASFPGLCWHCSHRFHTVPVRLPRPGKTLLAHLVGFFCSFDCARGWARRNGGTTYQKETTTLLWLCAKKYYGGNPCLQTAPSPEILLGFGGHVSIETYRQNFLIIDNYDRLKERLVFHSVQLETVRTTRKVIPLSLPPTTTTATPTPSTLLPTPPTLPSLPPPRLLSTRRPKTRFKA